MVESYPKHFKKSLALALPVMLTQVGQITVNVADNVMVGRLGKEALGAVSLGNAVFFSVLVFCIGFSFSMSPLIAEADAKLKRKRVSDVLAHGLLLNLLIGMALLLICWMSLPLLNYLNQPADVLGLAIPYIKISLVSLIPFMIFQSYRQLAEGLSLTIPVTIATILANVINILLNYALIYGNWGFKKLGVDGAAYGTLASRISLVVLLLLVLIVWKKSRYFIQSVSFKKLRFLLFRKIMNLGFPTAFQMFFEVSAFSAAAFICGMVSKEDLAAHQIAINMASISFLLVTGLAVAATIRVGNQLGMKNYVNLRRVGVSAIVLSVVFMLFFGLIFILFKNYLPTLYIDNAKVIKIAANLLIVAAFFQLFDGVQVVCLGALRGMQDVLIPFVITFFAYWAITIPLAYYLAIPLDMKAYGVWVSLGVGLAFSALFLVIRLYLKTKRLIVKAK